ncbi:MAG: GntR family transcriptional regulator/MocR family aminotransferase [Brevundimonas sp.]|jgi:GntR family transcriptional regulator/MocR family aminotransferase|uniref:MocR-like pyridoxine biosynthesis transcription factor PdxR n=1 Tax=Brevundimonas sp. TaxID=1871086 RepID=UPI00248928C7|nr:PLP-dependent aminotransferase family protein [Brevundimonas sp.]MDI1281835.1 PLP-dependent aminotransferase family protein [Brevundimonas sp.]
MSRPLIFLDSDSALSLQDQVRRKLVEAACAGAFPAGQRLPSSRALATQLGVARNTVTLAYQKLLDEGLFVSRERSGIYIDQDMVRGLTAVETVAGGRDPVRESRWQGRFKTGDGGAPAARRTPNWHQYPYPFIDGVFDASLFPVAEWREANRQALTVDDISQWSIDAGDADDPMLIEEIRTKVLPRRGIQARPDEILITVGTQQALSLLTQMLIDATTVVAVEDPGYPDLRRMVASRGARTIYQPVDDEGVVVDRRLDDCDILYVTPSHQFPTGVMMTRGRREALLKKAAARNMVVIEDDFDCETNYLDEACPALYSLDPNGQVIYVASLSKILGPGLRMGFVVAPAEVITELRRLRTLAVRHPPLNNQRIAAHFLAMGHYNATMMRLGRLFRERRTALRDALNHYLQQSVAIGTLHGGAAYWVRGPDHLDVDRLAVAAERRGVLIEPVGPYYADGTAPRNIFRLGVTSLPLDRIREGVAILADLMRDLPGVSPIFPHSPDGYLGGDALRLAMTGATLLCKTVYGDPCTIELHPDGSMSGRAGYANEDCDVGRWWVEGDVWNRRWNRWSYSEVAGFQTMIVDDRIGWFDADNRLVDSAVIRRGGTI